MYEPNPAIFTVLVLLGAFVLALWVVMKRLERADWLEYQRSRAEDRRLDRALTPPPARSMDSVVVGHTIPGNRPICVPLQAFTQHTLVVGATGAGKTNTLLHLIQALLPRACGLVVVDGKNDPGLAERLEVLAARDGRRFRHWSLSGPDRWDPLRRGTPAALRDKLMELFVWSEEHYAAIASRWLLELFSAAQQTNCRLSLADVQEYSDSIDDAARVLPALRKFVEHMTGEETRTIKAFGNRLASITRTQAAEWLSPDYAFDLAECNTGAVVLFSLAPLEYPMLAGALGRVIVNDLRTIVPMPRDAMLLVVMDELGQYACAALRACFAEARSHMVCLVAACQSLQQLDAGLRADLLANTSIKLWHRQLDPSDAQLAADSLGTHQTREFTWQVSQDPRAQASLGSVRDVHEYVVHPSRLKQLPVGVAALVTPTFRGVVRVPKAL
jgi:energy-coupling factor transporter ATP-binding protein EcfA2